MVSEPIALGQIFVSVAHLPTQPTAAFPHHPDVAIHPVAFQSTAAHLLLHHFPIHAAATHPSFATLTAVASRYDATPATIHPTKLRAPNHRRDKVWRPSSPKCHRRPLLPPLHGDSDSRHIWLWCSSHCRPPKSTDSSHRRRPPSPVVGHRRLSSPNPIRHPPHHHRRTDPSRPTP
jgi:hypothetical protein